MGRIRRKRREAQDEQAALGGAPEPVGKRVDAKSYVQGLLSGNRPGARPKPAPKRSAPPTEIEEYASRFSSDRDIHGPMFTEAGRTSYPSVRRWRRGEHERVPPLTIGSVVWQFVPPTKGDARSGYMDLWVPRLIDGETATAWQVGGVRLYKDVAEFVGWALTEAEVRERWWASIGSVRVLQALAEKTDIGGSAWRDIMDIADIRGIGPPPVPKPAPPSVGGSLAGDDDVPF